MSWRGRGEKDLLVRLPSGELEKALLAGRLPVEVPSPAGPGSEPLATRGSSRVPEGDWRELLEEPPRVLPHSSFWASTLNLSNAILGAGITALPLAFAGLGLLLGSAAILSVALVTYFSLLILIRGVESQGAPTYAAAAEQLYGRWAELAVRLCIILSGLGWMVLYLVIVQDVVVGSDEWAGIVPDLFPSLPEPLPWYLCRPAVLTWVTLAVAPLLAARTLGGLAAISAASVASLLAVAGTLGALCVAAALQGRLGRHVRWLPDPHFFGDRPSEFITHMVATVPLILGAFTCQMYVHPIALDLRNYTPRRMRAVAARALGLSAAAYLVAATCGYALYGGEVAGNVLKNTTIDSVAELLGSEAAGLAVVLLLKVCIAVGMITSVPISVWPVRADILDLLAQHLDGRRLATTPAAFYLVTYTCLLAVYCLALLVSSAYTMAGVLGATCGTALGFVFPGLLAWRGEAQWRWQAFGALLVVLGAALTVAGVASVVQRPDDGG